MQKKIFYLIFLILLSACRLNTEALTTVDSLARDIPNIVITQVIYKEVENNQLTQEVYADEFQVFSQDKLVQVKQGRVKTYRDGEKVLEGKASAAQYDQDSEDANVTGPIEVYYHPEKTRITAQKLDWVKKDRFLTSTAEGLVEVEQDNGTKFQGKDFSVDMKTKTVGYRKVVTGKLYAEPGAAETGESEEAVGGVPEDEQNG